MKKMLLAIGGLFVFAEQTYAQDLSGIYDVDMSTGTLNVQIPVTAYSLGGNNFGTSLSYNAKGVPVREFAGIVGAHWNLNVGGGIQRVVKGLPDEWYSAGSFLDGFAPGSSSHPEYLPLLRYHQYRGRLIEGMETLAQKQDNGVFRDTESDEYLFSVGNIQFSFFVGRTGMVYCNTKNKYEVSFLTLDNNLYNSIVLGTPPVHPLGGNTDLLQHFNFKVKDVENGTTYFFSPSSRALFNVQPYFRSSYPLDILTSCEGEDLTGVGGKNAKIYVGWKLDSVVNTKNEVIQYTYEKMIEPPAFSGDSVWTRMKLVNNSSTIYPNSYDKTEKSSTGNPSYTYLEDTFYMVSNIKYPNGTMVNLRYNKTTPRLEYYKSTNNGTQTSFTPIWTNEATYYFSKLDFVEYIDNGISRLYKFDYTYFHTPSDVSSSEETDTHLGDEDDRYSLKLKNISVKDNNTGIYNTLYAFAYNNKKQRRHGRGLDYFGYFRGGSEAGQGDNFGNAGHGLYSTKNKNIDHNFAQYGVLKSVSNGTGGRVTFDYSDHKLQKVSNPLTTFPSYLNSYWREFPVDGIGYTTGAGLKIETIKHMDINDVEAGVTIQYQYSDGQLFMHGGFYEQPTHFFNASGNQISGTYEYENFVNPSGLYRGAGHSYGQVTETRSGINGNMLSRREVIFTKFSEGSVSRAHVVGGGKQHIGFPYTRKGYVKDWEIGLPKKILTYDNNALLLKEELMTYTFFTDELSSLNAKVLDTHRVVSNFLEGRTLLFTSDNGSCGHVQNYVSHTDPYRPFHGEALLQSVTTKSYQSDVDYSQDMVQYNYDSQRKLKSVVGKNSKGEYIETYNIYNYDLSPGSNPTLQKMANEGLTYLVASEQWNNGYSNPSNRTTGSKLLKGTIFQFEKENNSIYNKKVIETALESPLTYTAYMSGGTSNVAGAVVAAYNGSALPSFVEEITDVKQRDVKGNPLETYLPQNDIYKAMIWDTLRNRKEADVVNARYSDIAYAGFERAAEHNVHIAASYILEVSANGVNVGSGFTEYIPVSSAVLGNKFCLITVGSTAAKRIYTQGLQPGIRYRATFWASQNAIPQFGIEGGVQFTLNQIAQRGHYKQYEVFFSPSAANQKIGLSTSAANVAIDELRIHPVEAQMTTYTYEPLNGTASETDALGRFTLYEYDGLGRLKLIRNQEGHIIEKKTYGTQISGTNEQ